MRTSKTTQLLQTVEQIEERRRSGVEDEEPIALLLQFALGEEQYALKVDQIGSVEDPPRVVRVPGTPTFLLGVVNLQSEVVAVVGLREFLGFHGPAVSGKPRLIVVSHEDDKVAFLVDEVIAVIEVAESAVESPLATLGKLQAGYLEGETRVNGQLVGVLNLENIMTSPEMQNSRGD